MDDYRVSSILQKKTEGALHAMIAKQSLITSLQNIHYLLAGVSIILAIIVISMKIFNIHYQVEKNRYANSYTYIDI